MQLATVLTPITDQALEWSAQCGVTDLVHRYPGKDIHPLRAAIDHAGQYGLRISVIEGYLPIENIKLGVDDGRELEAMKTLIRQMGDLGIGILCYNFMAGTDWTRTRLDVPARGNARVTEFRKADAEQAVLLGYHPTNPNHETIARKLSPDALWQHLQRTLDELLPIAEACSVTLAMHPDDPPLPQLLGKPRIMCDLDAFEKLI